MLCLLAVGWLQRHMPLSPSWLLAIGGMLIAYVPMLLWAAARPSPWLVRTIVLLDWGYVVIAVAFVLIRSPGFDPVGLAIAWGTAAVVALFAFVQQELSLQQHAR